MIRSAILGAMAVGAAAVVTAAVVTDALGAPPPRAEGARRAPQPAPVAPSGRKTSGGVLDTSFAGDGMIRPLLGAQATAVAVQADGRIVAAGHGPNGTFLLLGFNADGTPDEGFGTNGMVENNFGGLVAAANAMAIQPDGRIVVGGWAYGGTTVRTDFALARYNPDGSLDGTFGTGGFVRTDLSGSDDVAFALALQPDGRIILAGWTETPDTQHIGLTRYETDGSLDPGFGAGGIVVTALRASSDMASAVALAPDGRIVVAGSSGGTQLIENAVVRYDADGTLDRGFGGSGFVTLGVGSNGDEPHAVVVQPDGKIVMAGIAYTADSDFELVRFNPDGTLDSRFGHAGVTTTDFAGGYDNATALILQPDGRLLAAGSASPLRHMPAAEDFALVRYNPDGTLDRSFGKNGKVTADIDGIGASDGALAVAVQPDGRLVAAGSTLIRSELDDTLFLALARWLP